MLDSETLNQKRYRKAMKRRKLNAMRRKLMDTYGENIGTHLYERNRKSAARHSLVQQFKKRGCPPDKPLPRMVPIPHEQPKKRGFFRRLFGA